MQFRLIEQETYSAAMNMAIDEAIVKSVSNNKSLPTIRFYKWKTNSISIGSNQNQDEINLEFCKKNNIDVVRRITGGRAVYHDKNDFTYSVVAPLAVFGSINKAYSEICSWIINSLEEMGIKSKLQNKNDIMVNDKKISGNAAKLFDNKIYLQHGTLVYDIDFNLMPKSLNIAEKTAREKIVSIMEFKNISQDKAYQALKRNFIENKNIRPEKLSKGELKDAEFLSKKYHSIEAGEVLLRNKGACYILSGN